MAAPKRGGILRRSSETQPGRPTISFANRAPSVIPSIPRLSKLKLEKDEIYAAGTGGVRCLQMTLQKTECPTQADINGFSALHMAALFGRLDYLRVLVEKYGISVDSASATGWRPIHLVMNKESGNRGLECLQYLLRQKADVNVQNQNGVSPLHKAASEGRTGCVRLLIGAGADVHAKDLEGQEPIDLSRLWGHRECAKYLASAIWQIDKQNLAQESSRLNEIKNECRAKEEQYLIKQQMELNRFNNLMFFEWLAKKNLPPPSARILGFLDKRAQSVALRKQSERWGGLGAPAHSPGEISRWDAFKKDRQPQPWNPSANPASLPAACIFRPQGVRLGVSPESSVDGDFSSFLFLVDNEDGEPEIRIGKVGQVFSLPALPRETIQRSFFPRAWPSRLKVPQGLKAQHIWDVQRKRPPSPEHRWTDQMALSLRQTLDPAFVDALKAHLATYSDPEVLFVALDSSRGSSKEPSSPSLSGHGHLR